jgi:uncharacterized protein (DUF1697 family)
MHIALLRAVNVGGHGKVSMADLKTLMDDIGFVGGRTLLQSGNLVFRADGLEDAAIERLLEAEAGKRIGLKTDVMARDASEWSAAIAANPFPDKAAQDPGHLLLLALKAEPAPGAVAALREAYDGPERFEGWGRHLHVVYPEGVGPSRLTTALIERRLGVRATARNWNTVLKLQAAAAG